MANNNKVVIIGANGTMGAGAGCVLAGGGYSVTLLARTCEKAALGFADAQNDARAEAIAERLSVGAYDSDLGRTVGDAAIVFESLAEDLPLKRQFFELIDNSRRPDTIVASGSSGLSIAEMARGRSDSFRRNFLGVHLFNPPQVIVGTEVIPGPDTDPAVVKGVVAMLTKRLGRKVIVSKDMPAFVGNRVGFKVLNETAQLAAEHGVAFIDYLIGPHTGRAMAPLATIDLVGWDVHKAIAYMNAALHKGCLGDKTPERGGFYRRAGKQVFVLDPKTGRHENYQKPAPIEFVEKMKQLHRVGRYGEALKILAEAGGADADLCRRVVLGYVSYALNRVGEVAASSDDVDTIMSYGFNWAPPTAIVDLLGAKNTVAMLQKLKLTVPAVVERAAASGARMFSGGILEYGRTFVG